MVRLTSQLDYTYEKIGEICIYVLQCVYCMRPISISTCLLSLSPAPVEPPFSNFPSTILLAYGNIPKLVCRHMKKHCLSREVQKLSPVRTAQANAILPTRHAKSSPLPGCAAASTCRNGIKSSCSR